MKSKFSYNELRTQTPNPNYQGLWCWECQAHTAYHSHSKTRQVCSNDGPSRLTTYTTFTCEFCQKKMYTPQAVDPIVFKRPAERGCLWIYWICATIGLPIFCWFLVASPIANLALILAIFLPTAATVIGLPWLIIRWSAKKYAIWKSWAEERGWKEPKRKKRLKMDFRQFWWNTNATSHSDTFAWTSYRRPHQSDNSERNRSLKNCRESLPTPALVEKTRCRHPN